MRLVVMQPYFFPFAAHFNLIARADQFVVFDTAQYIRRGWMHRNRILKPGGQDWQYIHLPVRRCPRDTLIRDIRLNQEVDWRQELLGKLDHYRGKAPGFERVAELVNGAPLRNSLAAQNVDLLSRVCDLLDLRFEYRLLSETDADPGASSSPGDRMVQIVKNLDASAYLNPPGGESLLDARAFRKYGIRLEIQSPKALEYETGPYKFHPGLSILDALMWLSPQQVKAWLINA